MTGAAAAAAPAALAGLLASRPAREPLLDGIDVVAPDWTRFQPLFEAWRAQLFADTWTVNEPVVTDAGRERLPALREQYPTYRLCQVALRGDALAGWSWGMQTRPGLFFMVNSAVVAAERRRGLYSALARRLMQQAAEAGFQQVQSVHNVANNAIIIAKLKLGFMITGLEQSDTFGSLVQLSWYPHPQRRALAETRAGQRRPAGDIRRLLGIDGSSE